MRATVKKTAEITVEHPYQFTATLAQLRLALMRLARHAPKHARLLVKNGPEGGPVYQAKTTVTATWTDEA